MARWLIVIEEKLGQARELPYRLAKAQGRITGLTDGGI
jgi:hypothetical protein